MSQPVDSFRKHQKTIIIGFAIAVVALYMIPFDQLANANARGDAFRARMQGVIDRIHALSLAHPNVPGLGVAENVLTGVQYRVGAILDSHGGL